MPKDPCVDLRYAYPLNVGKLMRADKGSDKIVLFLSQALRIVDREHFVQLCLASIASAVHPRGFAEPIYRSFDSRSRSD
jgi:hypothetical protein